MPKNSMPKVQVSPRALLQRINRKLAGEGEMVRKARPRRYQSENFYNHNTGEYYRINLNRNCLMEAHVDIVTLARDLKVIRAWEELKKD
jgi:hypothetical protein